MLARRTAQLALLLTTSAFVYCLIRGPIPSDQEAVYNYPPSIESRLILEELVATDGETSQASGGELAAPVVE